MHEIELGSTPLDALSAIVPDAQARRLSHAIRRASSALDGRTIWHVNATAEGGGVAEMLPTLLAYGCGRLIRNRWLVLDGNAEFFTITKRIHNLLHGYTGDGGRLGEEERTCYERVLQENVTGMLSLVEPADIVVLHDPQTAGMIGALRAACVGVVWRSHIGSDGCNGETDEAWLFLRPYVEAADFVVFTREQYAPHWIDRERMVIMPPSIDPLSLKNVDLEPEVVSQVLAAAGLINGGTSHGPIEFRRRNGEQGMLRRHVGVLIEGRAPGHDVPLVVQVSRWDRLKDMPGVIVGFARFAERFGHDDVHLMLVGPEVAGVSDDPEQPDVLAECIDLRRRLPKQIRTRIHLATLPMDDVDENAFIVNALQRHAAVVVQKSLAEGFGLTVTEAMWKGRPVLASRVGGIQDQIADGRDGLLIDPRDPDAFADALHLLLSDDELAARLGAAARGRVLDEYLDDRHLTQYADLCERLCRSSAGAPTAGHDASH